MSTKHRRYNLTYAAASGGTIPLPLPTAFGHSSGDILVLDSMSMFFTASGATGTAHPGGWIKARVWANSSAAPAITQIGQIGYSVTGTASGINFGGIIWESVDGVPIWAAATDSPPLNYSNPSIPCTSYGVSHSFLGLFSATSPATEVYLSWHYENPSERR